MQLLSTVRAFSRAGYSVALIARRQSSLDALSEEIKSSGGDAASFCVPSYAPGQFSPTFSDIRSQFPASQYSLRAALFNVGYAVWKPFLEVTPEEVQESLSTNVAAAFSFSREAILQFKQNTVDAANPNRGTLIFTGATASMRGNTMTSAFSIGKFGARALSQSLAKEFGKDDIHAIIDGLVILISSRSRNNDCEGKAPPSGLNPESIAQSYLYLVNQEKSAWTWELDLRPAHEKW
ncbi:short-chain dehydrogenase/reductase SDR [Mycena maculata]|uniref:Short-chain dehydrogenase/reductase SDR n=1 Tax=Mycena maculata TaxID=230809 RepID=A0AAD7HK85_9AGAR|nr:short-chain dehydrogenase/reductase SDR [Mycena maculata]